LYETGCDRIARWDQLSGFSKIAPGMPTGRRLSLIEEHALSGGFNPGVVNKFDELPEKVRVMFDLVVSLLLRWPIPG
jgi:hypothetical protein